MKQPSTYYHLEYPRTSEYIHVKYDLPTQIQVSKLTFILPFCDHGFISQRVYRRISHPMLFNPLPDDKILDQTKLKAFADDKLNVNKNGNFCL